MAKIIESGSSLAVWRTCKKKYHFQYERKLSPKGYRSALGYGNLVHAWIEGYFTKRETCFMNQFAREKAVCQHQEDREKLDLDARIAGVVCAEWQKYWEAQPGTSMHNHAFHMLESEAEWSYEVKDGIHVGKRDGYLRHNVLQRSFLYEIKTASQGSESNYIHRLGLDHQISSNIIALQKQNHPVDGVLYDVLWKPMLRLKKGESTDDFIKRIRDDVAAHASEYFTRVLVERTPKHLEEYSGELNAQFDEIAYSPRYRNPSACSNYGSLCPYFDLCMDTDAKELENQFNRRDLKHPELGPEVQK